MAVDDVNFIIRGRTIRIDDDGFVSLNDLHEAAGFRKNRRPIDWYRLPSTGPFIIAAYEKIVGKSHQSKIRISDVYRAASGPSGGTWAHPIIAASYAGYLSPKLEVEMKEVWLRYRAGDVALADDILQRATEEQNEWAGVRALGRAKRQEFTKTLSTHGVDGYGFATCTDAIYKAMLDGTAKQLKVARELPAKANLRDNLSRDDLVFVMAAEVMARRRIEDENPWGNSPCANATRRSAERLRAAIEEDRRDSQKPLL